MSKQLTFLKEGWEDYIYWQAQDRKTLKRINALLQDIGSSLFHVGNAKLRLAASR